MQAYSQRLSAIPGELYIRGSMSGPRLCQPAAVDQRTGFANPYVAGTRLYRTGDLARYRADGNVEFLDGWTSQIKLRGYRIELGEIESVLSNFPGVHHAAVLLREDKPDQNRLVGYVAGESSLKDSSNRFAVIWPLASRTIWCHPSFSRSTRWPLSATGKVNRHALPAPEHIATPSGSQNCSQKSGRRITG